MVRFEMPLVLFLFAWFCCQTAGAQQVPIPAQPADPSQPVHAFPVGNMEPPRKALPVNTPSPAPLSATPVDNNAPAQKTLIIVADFSLKPVLPEMVKTWVDAQDDAVTVPLQFTTASGIRAGFGQSGDVVVSANVADVQNLTASGVLLKDGQHTVARNQLVLLGRHPLIRDDDLTWSDLMNREWRHLILANPKTTDLGRIAQYALSRHDLGDDESLKKFAKIVPTETQVIVGLTSTLSDAAFVYQTDIVNGVPAGFETFTLSGEDAPPVLYTAAAKKTSSEPLLCQSFIQFCASDEGQKIWKKYGYQLP